MSELKVYVMPLKTNIFGKTIVGQAYYSKAETDKVIAELKNRSDEGDKEFDVANEQNERLLKIVRHHKYKRCLAMTDKCGQAVSRYLAEGRLYEIDAMTAEGERHNELLEQVKDCDKAVLFYDRWYHRWSKIAEQCKCWAIKN